MEPSTARRRRKRGFTAKTNSTLSQPGTRPVQPGLTLFPLLLSACANLHSPSARSLTKRLLRSHLVAIRSGNRRFPALPSWLLALLPRLLASRYPSISVIANEILGAVAIGSLEENAELMADREVVGGLVMALGNTETEVLVAASNAVLDLSTSQSARERLGGSPVLEKLLYVSCQVAPPLIQTNPIQGSSHASKTCCCVELVGDRLLHAVLNAAVTLINSCNENTMESIPMECHKKFLALMKMLWMRLKCHSSAAECKIGKECMAVAKHEIAEAVFRLSMNEAPPKSAICDVERSIFGVNGLGFQHFLLNYWEDVPFLFRSNTSENRNSCFTSLYSYFLSSKGVTVIDPILLNAVSCPPITADELDILNFLKDVKGQLGSPMLYGQDIRIVKTQRVTSQAALGSQKEVHFIDSTNQNNTSCSKEVYIQDVYKCKQALSEQFTIALRGLEFRIREIANITNCLAVLFGQPSVGANLYLTPPESQGLSRHYDDHCVFVCQLLGRKKWVISKRRSSILPRLYDPLGSLHNFDVDTEESLHHILQEGDILYIPRGCTHEAHTTFSSNEHLSIEREGFSLHLTLAIEVESPFEWEGFIHVALHSWHEKQKGTKYSLPGFRTQMPLVVFIYLLHIAFRVISNYEPIFRKTCMIGSSSREHQDELLSSDRVKFDSIIDKIKNASNFFETIRFMETELRKGRDRSFEWLSWLGHLPQEDNPSNGIDFGNLFDSFKHLINTVQENLEDVQAAFTLVKTQFCKQVVFEDACKSYRNLLEKYRQTRKQYTNGMLALNSNV